MSNHNLPSQIPNVDDRYHKDDNISITTTWQHPTTTIVQLVAWWQWPWSPTAASGHSLVPHRCTTCQLSWYLEIPSCPKIDRFYSLTLRLSMIHTTTFSPKKTARPSMIQLTASTAPTISRWRSGWRSMIFSSSSDLPLTFTKYVVPHFFCHLLTSQCWPPPPAANSSTGHLPVMATISLAYHLSPVPITVVQQCTPWWQPTRSIVLLVVLVAT